MIEAIKWILAFLDRHVGFVTISAAFVAIYLYLKQKKDGKRDAALLILQEVRYAEQRIRNYKTYTTYSYTEKLLPTNSWHKNIHLFVGDLKESEIDLISKFYSSAAYLDDVIQIIAKDATNSRIQPPNPDQAKLLSGSSAIQTTGLHPLPQDYIKTISESIEFITPTFAINTLVKISQRKWYRCGL